MNYNQEDRDELRESLEECIKENCIYSYGYISFFLDKRYLDKDSTNDFSNILNVVAYKNTSCKYELLSLFFIIHSNNFIDNLYKIGML